MPDRNVINSTVVGSASLKRSERAIGEILIDAGRLKPEDAERILLVQRENGLRFGDAATQLGLLTQADIEFALTRQFEYLYPLRSKRTIGAILIAAGRLQPEDVERILLVQREEGLRFGDTAIQLGLLSQADIEFALSRQFDYPYLLRGESAVSEDIVAAYAPFSPQVEALRAVRSQLMLRWFDSDPANKALAIVSAERSEGRSFMAANLAVVFSQLGEHTLLIDADMRNPSQHKLFSLDNRAGLSAVLSGRGGPDVIKRIPSLCDLSVLPAGAVPPNPAELLARPLFPHILRALAAHFDVIIVDTPAATGSADAQTIAVRAGAALIVARKNASRIGQVRGVADSLADAKATVVGTVLNDV